MQYSNDYLLDGRYLLKQYIGGGSFGEVWLAHDEAIDVDVAVKIFISVDDTGLDDFKKEFNLTFELNHSNLLHASYLGINSVDKVPYLVMTYCPDGAISKSVGKLSEKEILEFILDVANGLSYLHARNIIHQDIKPENILKLKTGEYVITDFGISKQLRQTIRKTSDGENPSGAIPYMAPERFDVNKVTVKASDIWSLGVSIYELATGILPFNGDGGAAQKKETQLPELPNKYSKALNRIMQNCLAYETWDRPQAATLYSEVKKIIDNDVDIAQETDSSTDENKNIEKKTIISECNNLWQTVRESIRFKVTTIERKTPKQKRFTYILLFSLITFVVGIVLYINNENKRAEIIKNGKIARNIEISNKVSNLTSSASDFFAEGCQKGEKFYRFYMDAYRTIIKADTLQQRLDTTVNYNISDYSVLKQEIRDSLSSSYVYLNDKIRTIKELPEDDNLLYIIRELEEDAKDILDLIQ